LRIGAGTIPDTRLIVEIEGAVISVDNDLATWPTDQEAAQRFGNRNQRQNAAQSYCGSGL